MQHRVDNKMKIQGINIHFEKYIKDPFHPTMVLVHGFLSSTFSFRKLIPLLTSHFNIIAIDLPPFGKTEKSTRFTYSYYNMAKVIIDLLQRLNIQKAYAVGHSMGGQILLYAAKKQPDLFQKMVLLCSSGYRKRSHPTLFISSYLPYFSLIIRRRLKNKGVWKSLCDVVHDHSLINQEMIKGYVEPFYDNDIFRALTKMIRDLEGDLPSEELQKIQIPSLLIWGEEDRIVPIEIGKRLYQDLPNSDFISLRNTGHLVPEERPHHVSNFIFDFCLT